MKCHALNVQLVHEARERERKKASADVVRVSLNFRIRSSRQIAFMKVSSNPLMSGERRVASSEASARLASSRSPRLGSSSRSSLQAALDGAALLDVRSLVPRLSKRSDNGEQDQKERESLSHQQQH